MSEFIQDSIKYQILSEDQITPELNRKLTVYLSELFPEWKEVFAHHRAWHDAPPIWSTLAYRAENNSTILEKEFPYTIVGHVGIVERTITTCWNWRYRVASFQGVSVAPSDRKKGIGRRLLQFSLEEARRRNYPFAILFCKEAMVPYYESLGWKLPEDSMIMWRDRELPIPMRSNCPMYQELENLAFPEGPIDVHNPLSSFCPSFSSETSHLE